MWYNISMKLPLKKRQLLLGAVSLVAICGFFGVLARFSTRARAIDDNNIQKNAGGGQGETEFAEQDGEATGGQGSGTADGQETHFVTFYVDGRKLTVKTAAVTVGEALERAEIKLGEGDKVDPATSEWITSDFNINVYRARPVVVIDGFARKFIMTAAGDPKSAAADAGLTVYDGDEIKQVANTSFLEVGDATVYQITRNGGRLLTIEVDIPYETKNVRDATVAEGKEVVKEQGEVGRKEQVYQVNFVNGVEAERILISETVVKEPVAKIVATGTLQSIRPEWSQCAEWARQAGVSEEDLETALTLIYHESGCRVTSTNASSGAYGIPQALPGSKMASEGTDWETNPITQIKWMIKYVNNRYGGWKEALDFWWCKGECRGVKNKTSYWY